MKTIFDKIDPKYVECSAGTCEHVSHSGNGVLWCVVVALSLITIKYWYDYKNCS